MLQVAHPTPSGPSGHLPLTGGVGPGPHYGGRPPEKLCFISGAQNLTGGSKFPPGHWALGVQNLELLQFHNGAWVFSANAPGAFSPQGRPHVAARPQPSPYKGEGGWPKARRMRVGPETAENPQQTVKVSGPYGKAGAFPVFRRGGLWPPAVSPPHNLNPTTQKGALSTDRRNTQR